MPPACSAVLVHQEVRGVSNSKGGPAPGKVARRLCDCPGWRYPVTISRAGAPCAAKVSRAALSHPATCRIGGREGELYLALLRRQDSLAGTAIGNASAIRTGQLQHRRRGHMRRRAESARAVAQSADLLRLAAASSTAR